MTKPKKKKAKRPKASSAQKEAAHRRQLFIQAMLANGGNKTQAAIAAGFSEKSATNQGSRLCTHADVKAALEAARARELQKFEINTENVLRELARIAYFDVSKCYDANGKRKKFHEIDEDTRRAIASANEDGDIKAFSKPDALGKAMAYLNMLPKSRISVTAAAQSVAAAEVNQLPQQKLSDYEIARRVAFVLTMGAEKPAPPPPTIPSPKEPA